MTEYGWKACSYCGGEPDAAMLTMGINIAHADCVIRKLNELLDPNYDGKGEPDKIVGYTRQPAPVKFELTDTEIIENLDLENERQYVSFDESQRLDTVDVGNLLKAQIAKVLSLLEPVKLEALGDKEIIAEYESWTDINPDDEYQMKGLRQISQATIRKNQRGQLYRIRE